MSSLSSLKSAGSSVVPQGFRSDIQGLRAVAVALVVIFHMFPNTVTGGYVGVDVFFVISGFLITGLLIRQTERDGRVDYRDFYIRRARRLLPAACLALVITGLASVFILPRSLWSGTAREIIASAFYFENFLLYFQDRNYLTAETIASPFQHYWSLSIEEQFYVVWPVIIAVGVGLSKRLKWSVRPLLFLILGVIAAASLYMSATVTPRDPGAYFLTTTRIWELALGGLLALAIPYLRLRLIPLFVLRWAGLAAIIYSGLTFTSDTVFPGVAALIPTLGTLMLLLPDTQSRLDPGRILSLRPMTYLGDISYSLYLWHWPVIILGAYVAGGELAGWSLLIAFVLMMLLSHLSKYHLEDRFRHTGSAPRPGLRTLGLSSLFLGASIAVAAVLYIPTLKPLVTAEDMDRAAYPGALALISDSQLVGERAFIPAAETAISDIPILYADNCQVPFDSAEPRPCVYGNPNARLTIALVGDSHAAQYLPTLREIASRRDIRIVTHTKSSCAYIDALTYRAGKPYPTCQDWHAAVSDALLELDPDLVITAKFSSTALVERPVGVGNDDAVADALARSWQRLIDADIPVLAIGHTPRFDGNVPDCVSRPGNQPDDCSALRVDALSRPDHIRMASERVPGSLYVDMNAFLCVSGVCPAVIGNILVYRDAHHLTATYARTLSSILEPLIEQAISGNLPDAISTAPLLDVPEDLLTLVPNYQTYPGALGLPDPKGFETVRSVQPRLDQLNNDFHRLYRDGCYASSRGDEAVRCEFGPQDNALVERTIVLVGDNGLANWVPAIELYGEHRGVKVVTYLKSGCAFSTLASFRGTELNRDCILWADAVQSALSSDQPDALLISVHPTLISAEAKDGESGKTALARGMSDRLDTLDEKVSVILLAQLPVFSSTIGDCLIEQLPKGDSQECATRRTEALRRADAMAMVAGRRDDVTLIDLNDWICRQEFCHAIEGNIVVSKGGADITKTYMRTMTPMLAVELDRALGIPVPPG